MMSKFISAGVVCSVVCAGSVAAGPVMPEGQNGVAQGAMIDRSPAVVVNGMDLAVRVGDALFLHPHDLPLPLPIDYEPRIIWRWQNDDDPVKTPPFGRVVPGYRHNPPLPAACMHEYFTTEFGWSNYLGARCLEENFRDAASLPQHCAMTIRTENRLRDVYDEFCLRDAGYRVSGW